MRPPRRLAMIIALALAITGMGAAAGWLILRRDPSVEVGSVPITGLSVRAAPTTSATRSQQVDAFDRLEGTLRAGDDPGQFTLGSVDLDFGPDAWVLTAGPLQDYDQDQATEALRDELAGLTGRQVTTFVRPGDGGDEADVYVLNDLPYRDPAGLPPWTTTTPTSTARATENQLRTAAAAAVGEGARVDDLEPEPAGQVAWEASVTAADGTEYTVLLSAAGDVLDIRRS
jgi:peptidoglycan/xylan/chitin deacetylase (PgdA/CDA1 family)